MTDLERLTELEQAFAALYRDFQLLARACDRRGDDAICAVCAHNLGNGNCAKIFEDTEEDACVGDCAFQWRGGKEAHHHE